MAETALNNLSISEPWRSPEEAQPQDPLLRNWLLNTGSLTERLQSHCLRFDVELLNQQAAQITDDETHYLYQQFQQKPQATQVREVYLQGNGQRWVFARSLLPISFLEQEMAELTQLGNRPLGKIIFNDARFEREGFQLVECPDKGPTQLSLGTDSGHALWGRRSLFRFKEHRIMVAEIFLPGCPAYANN